MSNKLVLLSLIIFALVALSSLTVAQNTTTCLTSSQLSNYSAYCTGKGYQFSTYTDSNGCTQFHCEPSSNNSNNYTHPYNTTIPTTSTCPSADTLARYSAYCATYHYVATPYTDSNGCNQIRCTHPNTTSVTSTCLTSEQLSNYSAYCQGKGYQFSTYTDSNGCTQFHCEPSNNSNNYTHPYNSTTPTVCLNSSDMDRYQSYCTGKGGQFSDSQDSNGCYQFTCVGITANTTTPTTSTCLGSSDMSRYQEYCTSKGGQFSSSQDSHGCFQPKCEGMATNTTSEGVICHKTTASGCIRISCEDGFSLNICTGSGAYGSS